jgi:hypothetical protein
MINKYNEINKMKTNLYLYLFTYLLIYLQFIYRHFSVTQTM